MRQIVSGAAAASEPERLALDVYVHRLRASMAAMAASLGGLDALVFTGGVGERSPAVRAAATDGLAFLGVAIDATSNEAAAGDGDAEVTGGDGRVRSFVIPAREDVEIARGVRQALEAG